MARARRPGARHARDETAERNADVRAKLSVRRTIARMRARLEQRAASANARWVEALRSADRPRIERTWAELSRARDQARSAWRLGDTIADILARTEHQLAVLEHEASCAILSAILAHAGTVALEAPPRTTGRRTAVRPTLEADPGAAREAAVVRRELVEQEAVAARLLDGLRRWSRAPVAT